MRKKLLLLVIFFASFVSLTAFSPNIFSNKAYAIACGTRNAAGCEQSGTCADSANFTCTLVGTCNWSCIAKVSCIGTGGVCQNTACGPAGGHGGSCNTGLTCCNPGTANTCISQGGACKDSATCASEGGSNVGTVNCTGGAICCTPAGGGGGPPPPPNAQYPIGSTNACLGKYYECKVGGVDLNGKTCCSGLVCKGHQLGPTFSGTCDPIAASSGVTGCNDSSCLTAVGSIPTTPEGFVQKLFSVLLGISGGIAIILIIISGYKFMTSRGNPEQVQVAKEQLTAAVVGLLFVIFSLVILQTIGVDILNLPGFSTR